MKVQWFGQSAFLLSDEMCRVMIDPFADVSGLRSRVKFDYPEIAGVEAELVLITHEHADHNGAEAIGGDPQVIRATAGTFESPIGDVRGVASEHDDAAGTARGPNLIFVFGLGGVRTCHFGDFGQPELRDAQREAIGEIDLLFIPVGGGPTIGGGEAAAIVEELGPRWVVPMHYRTPATGFLEPADEFLDAFPGDRVHRFDQAVFDLPDLGSAEAGPVVFVPAAPGG
jgi:L-ascorbate metabolism protein UlaG (beta-lactamase superfamily)